MAKHERKPHKTDAKAERPQDQSTVNRWFGTDDASTATTGWEPEEDDKK